MTNTYYVGQAVDLSGSFTDEAGVSTDPTAVVCKVRKPDKTIVTETAAKTTTGVYHATIVPDVPGRWYYSFVGTGAVQAASESFILVEALIAA